MALISRAYWQPAQQQIVSFHQLGGTESWSNIIRVPYTQLTSGTGGAYTIVAFGHMGRIDRGDNAVGHSAVTAIRFDTGANTTITSSLSRVLIHDLDGFTGTIYNTGTGAETNRGHPFCIVYTVTAGAWPAATDLLLSASIEWQNAPPSAGVSFWVDASTVMVFDHTLVTLQANWVNYGTPVELEYSDVGETVIADGTTIPSTGRWWIFYSAQVVPLVVTAPYWTWVAKLADGVNPDVTYGLDGRGQITGVRSRSSSLTFTAELKSLYSIGGWYPLDVTNGTTKPQIRGFSFYEAATLQAKAQVYNVYMLAVKEFQFDDAVSEGITQVPSGFARQSWQTYQSLSVDAGADRPRYYAFGMSSLYQDSGVLVKSGNNVVGINGLPVRRFAFNGLNTPSYANEHSPSYSSYIADQTPFLVREGDNALQMNSLLNPNAGEVADFTSRFSTIIGFSPTNDGDWTPPVPRTIAYTPITLLREVDAASLVTIPLDPSHSVAVEYVTGVESFVTHDGHVIRWPKWSKPRRIWRLEWILNEPDTATLLAFIAQADQRAVKLPTTFAEAPSVPVILSPGTLQSNQLQGRLVSNTSVVAIESVYFTP